MSFSGAWGKMIHEKNRKKKFSWHCLFKGTQDWDFFWLRFWNLYYFFISYVKILGYYKKFFDQAIIGGDTIFPLSLRLSGTEFSLVWD
jgi:hypothetical protein